MNTWEEAVESLRNDPGQEWLVRACYYDDPLLDAANRYVNDDEWKAVKSLLPPTPGKVLDIGAGRGISSYAFAKNGWEVTALEPNPSLVVGAGAIASLAKLGNCNIQVVEEWGESLPFSDEIFDVVYGRAVFHHARDLESFCEEASRVLKPGGLFLITREHVISKHQDLEIFLKNHPLHHLYGGEAAYLLEEYENAISAAGLCIVKRIGPASSPINYFPHTQEEHWKTLKATLIKTLGWKGGYYALPLLRSSKFRSWVEGIHDESDSLAGRLYSFLCEKRRIGT